MDHKLYYRNVVQISILCLLITGLVVVPVQAGWSTHMVQQVNGFDILAESQLPSVEIGWDKMLGESHMVYMPSQGPQGRILISAADYAGSPPTPGLYSDDFGATWNYQSLPAMCGLTYFGNTPLGNGKVMVSAGDRWLSNDYGNSWQVVGTTPLTVPGYGEFYRWDPLLVDKNGSGFVTRLAEGGYTVTDQIDEFGNNVSQGHIRFSTDEGYSWPTVVTPPELLGVSEVALTRAANGDIIAACRTNLSMTPDPLTHADFYSGLGTSISQDNGLTWSPVNKLYEYGRHHPSTALLPNGDLVMSYVVRAGYGRTPQGREQFGIEAVVSHDNGQTWDMDNRYILDQWVSTQDGTDGWMSSPMSTSTVVLPDGSILTEYGTGERVVADTLPRDVKVVHWSIGETVGANYIFRETSSGTWEVSIEVSGDGSTAGLSAYEIWVDGVDSSLVSFTENVLGTVVGGEYTPVGFLSGTFLQGDVDGSFNAGNFQGSGDSALLGIGMVDIDEPGSLPGTTAHVDLGVPALLGILSTPTDLTEANFRAISVGLFNAMGDGFLNNDLIIPTYEVIPFTFLLGDANGDGVVSAGDYAAVQANFGNTGATGGGLIGDANGDGVVSAGDYAAVQANFGNTSASTNSIPEPATMVLLLVGGLVTIVRKRK